MAEVSTARDVPAAAAGPRTLLWAALSVSTIASATCFARYGPDQPFPAAAGPALALVAALGVRATSRLVLVSFAAALWAIGLVFTILDTGALWSALGRGIRPISAIEVATMVACLAALALSVILARATTVSLSRRAAILSIASGMLLAALYSAGVFWWYAAHFSYGTAFG